MFLLATDEGSKTADVFGCETILPCFPASWIAAPTGK